MVSRPSDGPRPSHWMTRQYVAALALVGLLVVSGFVAFEALVAAHGDTLALVNVAGRQRMLSQRIALHVQRLADGTCGAARAGCAQALARAADTLESAHAALTGGGPGLGVPEGMSAAVARLYFLGKPSLNARMARFLSAARAVQSLPAGTLTSDHPSVRLVLSESAGPLLEALDRIVQQYQRDGEGRLLRLRLLAAALVLATLAVLLLEARLIFRPMVGRIQSQMDEIDRVNVTLEQRVDERTQALAAAKAEAEQAHRSKSRFLAAAGHDMLQPLQAGRMFAGMLEPEVSSDRGRMHLAALQRSQESLGSLVQSVLDISRLDAGAITPVPTPFGLYGMLDAIAAEFAPQAFAKGLRLNVVATSARVVSDRLLLERILRNLLVNAIRYTESGGVVLGARRRGVEVEIHVIDSGAGIAPAEQTRVFEEFVQVHRTGEDRPEGLGLGLGLGLTIVDRLCRLLGHRLTLCSIPDRGSRFAIICPAAPPATMESS